MSPIERANVFKKLHWAYLLFGRRYTRNRLAELYNQTFTQLTKEFLPNLDQYGLLQSYALRCSGVKSGPWAIGGVKLSSARNRIRYACYTFVNSLTVTNLSQCIKFLTVCIDFSICLNQMRNRCVIYQT